MKYIINFVGVVDLEYIDALPNDEDPSEWSYLIKKSYIYQIDYLI